MITINSNFELTKPYSLDSDTKAIKVETDKIPSEIIKTTAIKAKTDNLPVNPASQTNVDLIKVETDKIPATITKIDGEIIKTTAIKAKTDNLPLLPANESTSTSILAEIVEIEHHIHSNECWFGDATVPNAGIHEADEYSLTTFQIDSGNNDWGTAICVLGTSDTPCKSGSAYFDFHKLLITTTERTNEPYIIRWAWGNTEADAIAADHYSSTAYYPTATIRSAPLEIQSNRIPAGTKVWMNCKCANNTGTMNFLFGIHEYDA